MLCKVPLEMQMGDINSRDVLKICKIGHLRQPIEIVQLFTRSNIAYWLSVFLKITEETRASSKSCFVFVHPDQTEALEPPSIPLSSVYITGAHSCQCVRLECARFQITKIKLKKKV